MFYTLKARDIMATELVVGRDGISIEEAIKIIVNNRITGFPIIDPEGQLVGVLSEFDIMRTVDTGDEAKPIDLSRPADFSRKVKSVKETAQFQDILKTFIEKKVRRLPVVNTEGRLVGIITRRDIMKALYYRAKLADK